jgi:hypothetical protein
VYVREVVVNTTAKLPVIQPTGMQMLRYWQAYMSVKDSEYPNPDIRTLAVVLDMVQIRLSSLLITVGTFFLAVIAACVAKYRGMKHKLHRIQLPSSQLDWLVQAAREHAKIKSDTNTTRRQTESPNEFAIHNQDKFFIMASHFDPRVSIDSELLGRELDAALSLSLQSQSSEVDFDPWIGYSETHLSPMLGSYHHG